MYGFPCITQVESWIGDPDRVPVALLCIGWDGKKRVDILIEMHLRHTDWHLTYEAAVARVRRLIAARIRSYGKGSPKAWHASYVARLRDLDASL